MFILQPSSTDKQPFFSTVFGKATETLPFFTKHLAYFGVSHLLYQFAEKFINVKLEEGSL